MNKKMPSKIQTSGNENKFYKEQKRKTKQGYGELNESFREKILQNVRWVCSLRWWRGVLGMSSSP